MSHTTDTCPGCGRTFAPGGYTNHLRFSRDPQCGLLRDNLMYRYTTSLVNPLTHSPSTPQPTTPDVQMLDILNNELPPHSNIFPSPSHEEIYMSIDDDIDGSHGSEDDGDDDYDDNDSGSNNNDDNENDDSGSDDTNSPINQSLETVFHHPSQLAATVDLDTGSEISDEEEEDPQQPVSLSSNPGPSSMQTGRSFDLTINLFLTSSKARSPELDDPVTIRFGGRAGEALSVPLEHVGYMGYSHALHTEDDTPNEWAPFSTCTEWELAQWAKLRGPSSTALSELLKIDGVSCNFRWA